MKKLITSTAVLTSSNVVSRAIAMIFFVLLARALTVADYGLFRYLISLASMHSLLFTGVPVALTKFLGYSKKNSQNISKYFTNTLSLSGILFIILVIAIFLLEEHPVLLTMFLFAAYVDSVYIGFTRGLLNIKKLAGFKFVQNLTQLFLLGLSIIMYSQINFLYAIIFYSLAGLTTVIIFELMNRQIELNFNKVSLKTIKKLTLYAIPVTLGSVGWIILFSINTIYLKNFYSTELVGQYSVGETLVQIFSFLPGAIATILLPKVASLKNIKKIVKPLILAVSLTLIVSFAMLVLLLLFKETIITLIFTDKYVTAAAIIAPLAIGQIFISFHQLFASIFQGANKPSIPSITISIGCFVALIAGFFLTRDYGLMGAAISTAAAAITATTILFIKFTLFIQGEPNEN